MQTALTQAVLRQTQRVQRRHRLQGPHQLPQARFLIAALLQQTAVGQVQLCPRRESVKQMEWQEETAEKDQRVETWKQLHLHTSTRGFYLFSPSKLQERNRFSI